MKIKSVTYNNHKKSFELTTSAREFSFPFALAEPKPSPENRIKRAYVDKELSREALTYELESGAEGTVHIEQVLEYNQDPAYLRDQLLYKLTLEARKQLQSSPLSKREIIRRLHTSPTQFYRLVDQTNYNKSIDKMLALLHVLDCTVDLVVTSKTA